jgi:hypothetical protein
VPSFFVSSQFDHVHLVQAEKAMGESRAKAVLDECAAKFGQRLPAYDACLRSANVNLDLLGMALEGIKVRGAKKSLGSNVGLCSSLMNSRNLPHPHWSSAGWRGGSSNLHIE